MAETFAPFLSTTISELIQLMAEADSLESKRKVDESLNKVIERSGILVSFCRRIRIIQFFECVQVIPFITVITEPIPHLCKFKLMSIE